MFDINYNKGWFFGMNKMSELTIWDFPNQMVGRPTSDLLLDTNLIPFQVCTLPILSHRQLDSLTTFISIESFWFDFDFEDTDKDWQIMQELLGFFLVANDETRRNVNSLIKVAIK